jgi:hypothetical protein
VSEGRNVWPPGCRWEARLGPAGAAGSDKTQDTGSTADAIYAQYRERFGQGQTRSFTLSIVIFSRATKLSFSH